MYYRIKKHSGNPVLAIPSLNILVPRLLSAQIRQKADASFKSKGDCLSYCDNKCDFSLIDFYPPYLLQSTAKKSFFLVKKEWQVFRIYEWKFLSGFFNSKILYIWAGGTLVPGWIWQIFQTYVPSFKNVNKCQKIFHGVSSSHFFVSSWNQVLHFSFSLSSY